jgi:hypothetical protein
MVSVIVRMMARVGMMVRAGVGVTTVHLRVMLVVRVNFGCESEDHGDVDVTW